MTKNQEKVRVFKLQDPATTSFKVCLGLFLAWFLFTMWMTVVVYVIDGKSIEFNRELLNNWLTIMIFRS